jgi:hypothetical protein
LAKIISILLSIRSKVSRTSNADFFILRSFECKVGEGGGTGGGGSGGGTTDVVPFKDVGKK